MSDHYYFPKDSQFKELIDQGVNVWINYPDPVTSGLMAARVEIYPMRGHDFHRHPGREELIIVVRETIEQWIEESCHILSEGDAVVIPEGVSHASFNIGQTPAELFVILTPTDLKLSLSEDLSSEPPWNTLQSATNP